MSDIWMWLFFVILIVCWLFVGMFWRYKFFVDRVLKLNQDLLDAGYGVGSDARRLSEQLSRPAKS